MPDIIVILFFLFAGLGLLLWIAQKNPVNLTEEQQGRMGKWIRILIGLIMLAWVIRACTGAF